MRAPLYGQRSLAEVLPSIAASLGCSGFENRLELPALSQVVVVVVDGLGDLQLRRASEFAPLLCQAAADQPPVDAAFPTTTPAGIATLALAMTPGRHGFVGATFELPDFERVLNPLHWEGDPPPVAVQPEPNVFSRMQNVEIRSHGPAAFADSGMTRSLLHAATQIGYERFDPRTIARQSGRLDYVYLPQLDKVGHGEGPNSGAWNQCLRGIDGIVRAVCARLPETAGVFVTSDHGMVLVPDDRRIDIDRAVFMEDVRVIAGEPRMRHIYTDNAPDVRERWSNELGERATVLRRGAAIAAGLFGEVDGMLRDRIGDVIAIASGNWSMASQAVDARVSSLRGLHGALTDEELLVPAVLLRGVA